MVKAIRRCHFNPLSSCEERPHKIRISNALKDFNPLSSCEERLRVQRKLIKKAQFQSTLLMRGETKIKEALDELEHFNPLSSCEERLQPLTSLIITSRFQSTLLMRGETCGKIHIFNHMLFQSTLLMRGETRSD